MRAFGTFLTPPWSSRSPGTSRGRRTARTRASAVTVLAAAVLLLAGCGETVTAPDQAPVTGPGDYARVIVSGDRLREYDLHVPPRYGDASSPAPVAVLLHGVPPVDMARLTGFETVADETGLVVAYPLSATGDWNVGCGDCTRAGADGIDDVGFVRDVVDDLDHQLEIDRDRILVAGYSQGALLVQYAACLAAADFAAFGSVAATTLRVVHDRCRPAGPTRMLFVHGTEDAEFPWDGASGRTGGTLSARGTVQAWAERNGCAFEPEVEALPDAFDDGTRVDRESYAGCRPGGDVLFYAVHGGGHAWPGSPLDFQRLGPRSLDLDANDALAQWLLAASR